MLTPLSRSRRSRPRELTDTEYTGTNHFKTPTEPQVTNLWLPSEVIYSGGDPRHIETILPYLTDTTTLGNTIVILKDQLAPQRLLLIITTLKSHFFPRGTWKAYIYVNQYPDPLDYHRIGSFTLVIEPHQIPAWQTWRLLVRRLRATQPIPTKRKIHEPSGLLIDPPLRQLSFLCGEGR